MLMTTEGLMVPTIHMNGTSRESLIEQLCNAVDAMHDAGKLLAAAAPNGRDYYPQGNDAIYKASKDHEARMASLRKIIDELSAIAYEIGA